MGRRALEAKCNENFSDYNGIIAYTTCSEVLRILTASIGRRLSFESSIGSSGIWHLFEDIFVLLRRIYMDEGSPVSIMLEFIHAVSRGCSCPKMRFTTRFESVMEVKQIQAPFGSPAYRYE